MSKGLYEPYDSANSFEHEYLPKDAHDEEYAGVGDGGIYCRNCTHGDGDPRFGKHEHEVDPISWSDLREHYPHGTSCDNCYKPLVSERPHTANECELGRDCPSWSPHEEAETYGHNDEHKQMLLQDMRTEGVDIDHKPEVPHLTKDQAFDHDFGSQHDLDREKWDGEQWAAKYRQRKADESHAESLINDLFHGTPEAEFMKGNSQGPTHLSHRRTAYGETKAPTQVDTLRDDSCPVCGDTDSYDGDQCQVCGFVSPPKMFQDPDLQKARLLDLRADPATGAPNDTNPNIGQNLPPVDPSAVDEDGDVAGEDIEGQEAGQIPDEDGVVEGEVRSLGDAPEDGEPLDPEDLDGQDLDGDGVPDVDLSAPGAHVNQGGEPFTKGPNAPDPAEPMDPAAALEDEEDGNPDAEAADGQMEDAETAQDPGEPGYGGDGVPDLMCPACGYEADAAQPVSTSMDANAPADSGDGLLEGDVCPQCQKATLMGTGQIEQMEQAAPQPGPM